MAFLSSGHCRNHNKIFYTASERIAEVYALFFAWAISRAGVLALISGECRVQRAGKKLPCVIAKRWRDKRYEKEKREMSDSIRFPSVTIPETITYMGRDAFLYATIKLYYNAEATGTDTFEDKGGSFTRAELIRRILWIFLRV